MVLDFQEENLGFFNLKLVFQTFTLLKITKQISSFINIIVVIVIQSILNIRKLVVDMMLLDVLEFSGVLTVCIACTIYLARSKIRAF